MGRTEAERRTWEKEKATHAQRKKRGDRRRATPKRGERERKGTQHTPDESGKIFAPPPLLPTFHPRRFLGMRERGNKSQLFPVVGSQCMCVHARPFLLLSLSPRTTKSLL